MVSLNISFLNSYGIKDSVTTYKHVWCRYIQGWLQWVGGGDNCRLQITAVSSPGYIEHTSSRIALRITIGESLNSIEMVFPGVERVSSPAKTRYALM